MSTKSIATSVIKLTCMINLGAFVTHLIIGNPYAAIGHFLIGLLGVLFLGGTKR